MAKSVLKNILALDLDENPTKTRKNAKTNTEAKTNKPPLSSIKKRKRSSKTKSLQRQLETLRKEYTDDKTEQNMEFFRMLSKDEASSHASEVLNFHSNELDKRRKVKKPKKKKAEETMFTEKDFLKFEKEYFVGGRF